MCCEAVGLIVTILAILAIPWPRGEVRESSGGASILAQPSLYTEFSVRPLEADERPYRTPRVVERVDEGVHDSEGVRMFEQRGVLHNHPVAQSQYGLANLASWAATQDVFFLNRAAEQASRLALTRVESNEAWFFPYPFDFPLHGGRDVMRAPWFSAMAQGHALSLFVWLHEATGSQRWLSAAEATFESLLLVGSAEGLPSVVHTFEGNLWLEEYPRWPSETSGHALNGHIFAIYGVYDYYLASQDTRALSVFRRAASTVLAVFDQIRVPGEVSRYCLSHQEPADSYHSTHVSQLEMLRRMTSDARFGAASRALERDHPVAG